MRRSSGWPGSKTAHLTVDETARIFAFLIAATERGERPALVSIAAVHASSSRSVGTHFAVSSSGEWCGSLSGGCIEAAVAGEALRVLSAGKPELLRLGQGSPLVDIRLPCGGGLDLLIVPQPDLTIIRQVQSQRDARQPALLVIGGDGSLAARSAAASECTNWDGNRLAVRHDPQLRLAIFGQGEEVLALARQGQAFDAELAVYTPDTRIAGQLGEQSISVTRLETPDRLSAFAVDPYTAAILLFHDHDWETGILAALLRQPCLMIGAMGSPATQARRLDLLRARGVVEADLARIIGPVGLIPATRDPALLALSIMAQVGQAWSMRTSA